MVMGSALRKQCAQTANTNNKQQQKRQLQNISVDLNDIILTLPTLPKHYVNLAAKTNDGVRDPPRNYISTSLTWYRQIELHIYVLYVYIYIYLLRQVKQR